MFCLFSARSRTTIPFRDGAGRPAEGDLEEVHLRGDSPLQAEAPVGAPGARVVGGGPRVTPRQARQLAPRAPSDARHCLSTLTPGHTSTLHTEKYFIF